MSGAMSANNDITAMSENGNNHDPLCPPPWKWGDGGHCQGCDLIAKVREDAADRVYSLCAHTKHLRSAPCIHDEIAAIVRQEYNSPLNNSHDALCDASGFGPREGCDTCDLIELARTEERKKLLARRGFQPCCPAFHFCDGEAYTRKEDQL